MVDLENLQKHLSWDGIPCCIVKSEDPVKVEISGRKRSVALVEKTFENYDALYNFLASCDTVWVKTVEVNSDETVGAVLGWLK